MGRGFRTALADRNGFNDHGRFAPGKCGECFSSASSYLCGESIGQLLALRSKFTSFDAGLVKDPNHFIQIVLVLR